MNRCISHHKCTFFCDSQNAKLIFILHAFLKISERTLWFSVANDYCLCLVFTQWIFHTVFKLSGCMFIIVFDYNSIICLCGRGDIFIDFNRQRLWRKWCFLCCNALFCLLEMCCVSRFTDPHGNSIFRLRFKIWYLCLDRPLLAFFCRHLLHSWRYQTSVRIQNFIAQVEIFRNLTCIL